MGRIETKGGHLIILGAGPQQKKLYELASKANHKIVGIDKDLEAPARALCDIFVCTSIRNSKIIIQELEKLQINYSGVVTCGAEVSPQVSAIASHFGLKGIPYDVAIATTDKARRSKILHSCGIPAPAYQVCDTIDDITMSVPCVIKPVDSSGSRGVVLVKNQTDIQKAFQKAQEISSNDKVICEEYISEGIEVSIEAFVIDGLVYITGIAERHFLDIADTAPNFVEYGGTMPPTFGKDLITQCKKIFENAVHALGIREGPSKGDLIIKDKKVYVLEVTSRTSPGFAAEMQPLNSGIEPLNILLKWATGAKVCVNDLTPKFDRGVAHRYYLHDEGTIKRIDGIETLQTNKFVKYYLMLDEPYIGKYLDHISYMNRMFYIITMGESNAEAIENAEEILSSIKIEIDK